MDGWQGWSFFGRRGGVQGGWTLKVHAEVQVEGKDSRGVAVSRQAGSASSAEVQGSVSRVKAWDN